MTRKISLIILTFCLVLIASQSCKHKELDVYQAPENTFTIKGPVHEMNLYPDLPPEFPEHVGKAEFTSYCAICHSLKYISTQPNFPVKTWEAEVNKMIQKYHAPIDSVTAGKILNYLVAVKGK